MFKHVKAKVIDKDTIAIKGIDLYRGIWNGKPITIFFSGKMFRMQLGKEHNMLYFLTLDEKQRLTGEETKVKMINEHEALIEDALYQINEAAVHEDDDGSSDARLKKLLSFIPVGILWTYTHHPAMFDRHSDPKDMIDHDNMVDTAFKD